MYKVTNPCLATRAEAEELLFKIKQFIEEYGYITVDDVYDMVCMLDEYRSEYDCDFGWTSVRDANINWSETYGGYEICLPIATRMSFALGTIGSAQIRLPKTVAEITICGAVHIRVDDTMDFIRPTPEQIKNLHDMLCIDVKLCEEVSE